MSEAQSGHVSVQRRITVPAARIFRVLADPRSHVELDGSGMVRGSSAQPITGVGDVFTVAMHFPALGDYEMDNHVVEFELDRRIAWERRPDGATRRRDPAGGGVIDGASSWRPMGQTPRS
jgi:hypothetical protein